MIIGIGGEPNTGKTAIVRHFAEGRSFIDPVPVMRNGKLITLKLRYHLSGSLYVLGHYRGDTFDGTDTLDMSIQPGVIEWIERHPNAHILFEGARLFNRSFIEKIPGTYIILQVGAKELAKRRMARQHNPAFIQSMKARYENLKGMPGVITMKNNNEHDQQKIIQKIEKLLKPTVDR